jgi:cytoskeletal protein RodZ
MKINIKTFISKSQHNLTKFMGGLLILALVWQGVVFRPEPATASPLFATSAASISQQVTGKAEEVKGSAKQKIGKAQSAMEDQTRSVKMKIKDDLTEAKIAVDANNARVKNTAEKSTTAVKNFFGQ